MVRSVCLLLVLGLFLRADAASRAPLVLTMPPSGCSDPEDHFGRSLATTGSRLVVGAPGEVCGFAFVFDAHTGRLLHTLRSPRGLENDLFGQAVAALGRDVIVGAPRDGAAYRFDGRSGVLRQTYAIPAGTTGSFAFAVAGIGTGRVAVAAPDMTEAGGGSVHVYDANSGELVVTIPAPADAAQRAFGASLAAVGRRLAVGAPGSPGRVYIVDPATGEVLRVLSAPTPLPADDFGRAVAALNGDILVGAPGAEEAYRYDGRTGALVAVFADPHPDIAGRTGAAIAGAGNLVAVGEPTYFAGDGEEGAAHVFDARTGALKASQVGTTAGELAGFAVAIIRNSLAFSSPGDRGVVRVARQIR